MAQKASGSVAGLCNWCEAMKTYHFVAKVVDPKIIMLSAAEAELKVAMKAKQAAEDELAKVQANLDEMQAKFDAAMAQKQALEDDAAACQRKMDSRHRAHLRARGRGGALDGAVQAVRPADPAAHGRLRARVVVRVLPRPVQQGVPRFALAAATFTATASSAASRSRRTST